jgi:hypothetical protein
MHVYRECVIISALSMSHITLPAVKISVAYVAVPRYDRARTCPDLHATSSENRVLPMCSSEPDWLRQTGSRGGARVTTKPSACSCWMSLRASPPLSVQA